jgi:hypothetical protein
MLDHYGTYRYLSRSELASQSTVIFAFPSCTNRPDGSGTIADLNQLVETRLKRMQYVVERTLAWVDRCRRLGRDFEQLTAHAEAMVHITMTALMLRRLAGQQETPLPQQQSRPAVQSCA